MKFVAFVLGMSKDIAVSALWVNLLAGIGCCGSIIIALSYED